jgi:ubiquinone/menaquinone biosynthesis C-methylase UbiE
MANLWRTLVRFGFRMLYHEFAWTYDTVSKVVSFGQWRCWQRAALPHLGAAPGAHILEIAHGTGDLQLDLYAAGYRAAGIDASRFMGRIAARKLRAHSLTPRLTRAMANALPFPDGIFEAIVCTFPTPFILEAQTLHEARRVLVPGGRLVIVPNAALTGRSPGSAVLEWLYRATGQRESETFDTAGYFARHGFTAQTYQVPCWQSLATVIVAASTGLPL